MEGRAAPTAENELKNREIHGKAYFQAFPQIRIVSISVLRCSFASMDIFLILFPSQLGIYFETSGYPTI